MDGCSRQNPAYRPTARGLPATGALSVAPHVPLPNGTWPVLPGASWLEHIGAGAPVLAPFSPPHLHPVRPRCEHVFVIVCVLLPRFALAVAAGGREVLAAGPVALAPEPGRGQFIGEASAAAEAYGVRAGLRLGEALARCPTLRLVAPDPAGVADAWERRIAALEGIGAAVESGAPGTAWFSAGGLKTLHGGTLDGVLAATRL